MQSWQTVPIAISSEIALTLAEFLTHLRKRGSLFVQLRDALVEKLLMEVAAHASLTISTADLQQAAERFRYRHGLTKAANMHSWLAARHLSLADFEDALERDLLIDRLRDHLTRDQIDTHFAAYRAEFDRVRVRQVIVARDDLAEELSQQVRDDGADFAVLAQQHGSTTSETLQRRQLPAGHADIVFAAAANQLVGPLSSPQGFHLYQIEESIAAELDAPTRMSIRDQLFEAWLQHKLANAPMTFPLLDLL